MPNGILSSSKTGVRALWARVMRSESADAVVVAERLVVGTSYGSLNGGSATDLSPSRYEKK
jgi:hypothetical protein